MNMFRILHRCDALVIDIVRDSEYDARGYFFQKYIGILAMIVLIIRIHRILDQINIHVDYRRVRSRSIAVSCHNSTYCSC